MSGQAYIVWLKIGVRLVTSSLVDLRSYKTIRIEKTIGGQGYDTCHTNMDLHLKCIFTLVPTNTAVLHYINDINITIIVIIILRVHYYYLPNYETLIKVSHHLKHYHCYYPIPYFDDVYLYYW